MIFFSSGLHLPVLMAIRDWSPGNFLVFTNLLSIIFCVSLILSCPFLFEIMNVLSISTNMGMMVHLIFLIFSFLSITAFLCFSYSVSHCWASSYCISLSLFISYKGFILLSVNEKKNSSQHLMHINFLR